MNIKQWQQRLVAKLQDDNYNDKLLAAVAHACLYFCETFDTGEDASDIIERAVHDNGCPWLGGDQWDGKDVVPAECTCGDNNA